MGDERDGSSERLPLVTSRFCILNTGETIKVYEDRMSGLRRFLDSGQDLYVSGLAAISDGKEETVSVIIRRLEKERNLAMKNYGPENPISEIAEARRRDLNLRLTSYQEEQKQN
tara:strand:+ start:33 stop:374 length:342 start_codon:yes stop_codon:yes gene_type:complete